MLIAVFIASSFSEPKITDDLLLSFCQFTRLLVLYRKNVPSASAWHCAFCRLHESPVLVQAPSMTPTVCPASLEMELGVWRRGRRWRRWRSPSGSGALSFPLLGRSVRSLGRPGSHFFFIPYQVAQRTTRLGCRPVLSYRSAEPPLMICVHYGTSVRMPADKGVLNLRGVPIQLIRRAKAAAALDGKTLRMFVIEAIQEKIRKKQ